MFQPTAEELLREVQDAFADLKALIAAYDPISLLSQLTLTYLFVPEEEFQGEASDVVTWQKRIELLTGLALISPLSAGTRVEANAGVLSQAEKLLERYFRAIDRQLLFEVGRPQEVREEDLLLTEAKIASLHVRGDAYPHQLYLFAREVYGPHYDWFHRRYGFTIAEAVDLAEAISKEYAERFNRSISSAREEARRKANELIAEHQAIEDQRRDLETRIGCALHFGQAESLLGLTAEELSACSGVPLRTCQCFLGRLSQDFGYRNPSFPTSFTEAATAPWDYNTLNERPLVRRGEKHWLFVPPLLRSALFNTFFFDLLNDRNYWPVFEKARGAWLETKTAECLRRIFPPRTVLANPYYPDGKEMADVIVLHDRKIL
jgi:hypothetical protein